MSKKLPSLLTLVLARQSLSRPNHIKRMLFAQSSNHRNNNQDNQSSNNHRKFGRSLYYLSVFGIIGAWAGFVVWKKRRSVEVACEVTAESRRKDKKSQNQMSLLEAVKQSEQLVKNLMIEHNSPGLVITVTVDGKEAWSEGFGLADVENGVPCTPSTVMRIASISKPLTMAAVAKLWEENKLDIDRPIQYYVPSWPEKCFEGEKVTITTRHLVSMLSGIRHYDKECNDLESKKLKAKLKKKEKDKKKDKSKDKDDDDEKGKSKDKNKDKSDDEAKDKTKDKSDKNRDKNKEKKDEDKKDKNKDDHKDKDEKQHKDDHKDKDEKKHKDDQKDKDEKKHKDDHKDKDEKKHKDVTKKKKGKDEKDKKDDSEFKEFYLKRHWSSVSESLELFKDDDLCCRPGSEYLYSTHTWTLVSAVIEGASGKTFLQVMNELFKDLGLTNTYLDEPKTVILNRARYYVMNKKGHLANAPYVDNSYKWAGGGLLSTSRDLCRFGNAMLFSFQAPSAGGGTAGFLCPETVNTLWSPVEKTRCSWDSYGFYGMGWGTIPFSERPPFTREQRQYFSHTGGAVGASSVLLVLPRGAEVVPAGSIPPCGVVVAIIVNMQSVSMNRLALEVAKMFERIQDA